MSNVVTLISDPRKARLDQSALARAHATLVEIEADPAEVKWLADGEACDIGFAKGTCEQIAQALRESFAGHPVDVIAQSQTNRKKLLLVADMDSTMVIGETLDDLAEHAGLKEKVAEITERAMNGEIEFKAALRERVALLSGLSQEFLSKTLSHVSDMPGAATLVATMKANGAYCALVSGGFSFFTGPISQRLGFDTHLGNQLELKDGTLTGKVLDPIVTRDTKLEQLIAHRSRLGLPPDQTCAVGDGANDLPMLLEAGLGIAYQAKPLVAANAHHRVQHSDLRALLFAQGYHKGEFVTPSS